MAKATKARKAPDHSKPVPLVFEYEQDGNWTAPSCLNNEGSPFYWNIMVLSEDGRFTICNSDGELFDRRKFKDVTYTTFAAAKNVCQSLDDGLRQAMKKQRDH